MDKENNQNNKIINWDPVVEAGLNWGIFCVCCRAASSTFVTELLLKATLIYKSHLEQKK